jgi:hypothetical protein
MIQQIKRKNMKWWVGIISCMVFFAGIGTFAYMKMDFILHGVTIKATVARTDSSIAEIKGNAQNAVYLSLNGQEIFIDKNGEFSQPVALLPGLEVITLDAADKFGNVAEKEFTVVYKDNSQVALLEK